MKFWQGVFLIWFVFFVTILPSSGINDLSRSNRSYHLLKYEEPGKQGFSGDNQHMETGEMVDPLRVKVVNQKSEPVIGIPVIFEVVSYPRGGGDYQFDRRMVTTDSSGMALVNFRLGTVRGEYQIIARIRSAGEENIQLFNLYARDQNWQIFLFGGVAGGLVLFLLGMEVMGRGLLRMAGSRMRSLLGNLSANRFGAMILGAFVTMVNQSSNATYVILLNFVNAKMMRLRQIPGIILGAGIGTAITVQVLAFQVTEFSLFFVAAGFAMRIFTPRGHIKNAGDALMGLGILFFGMHIMSEAIYPLRSFEPFLQVLARLEDPITGILAGTVLTAIVGSSASFAGIILIFGMHGLISLEASIHLILGAGTGAAVTAVVACIDKGREARIGALMTMLLKISGVLLFAWFVKPFASVVVDISPTAPSGIDQMAVLSEVLPRQIANAHIIYNVVIALLILPFTGIIARLAEYKNDKRVPEEGKNDKNIVKEINYPDRSMLKSPALALSLAKHETVRMGEVVRDMVSSVLPVVPDYNPETFGDIERMEKKVILMSEKINSCLLKISGTGISKARVNESFQILYTLKEMGEIAAISASAHRKIRRSDSTGGSFIEEEQQEVVYCHRKTCQQVNLALEVFREISTKKASERIQKYIHHSKVSGDCERRQYELFLREGLCGVTGSTKFPELIFMLRNISYHAAGISRMLLKCC